MRRLENLISLSREETGNTRYDANSGVSQNRYSQYFNNAQDELLKAIIIGKSKYLKTTEIVPVVYNQVDYTLPSNIFLQAVDTIQWQQTPTTGFTNLYKAYTKERIVNQVGYPFSYIPTNSGFQLNPALSNGNLLVTYSYRKNRLAVRAGQISAITQGMGVVSALTLTVDATFNPTSINQENYLCVVNRDGVQKAANLQYTSVNAGTGVFTLSAQTIDGTIAVGDYITVGKDTCNLPEWPDICESYLLQYADFLAKYGDSSKWSKEAQAVMSANFSSLAQSFNALSDDVTQIAITQIDYMSLDN